MSFDNSKYDVEIDGVGYRIENYRKSEFDPFIPRLGSGSQSESEFDLLRSKTLESFSAGMLQRAWEDDNSFFGSENLYPKYGDGVLYPVKDLASASDIMGKCAVGATCQTKDSMWIAYASFSAPTNYLRRIDKDGTITAITLPAAIQTAGTVNCMVVWGGKIWGCAGSKMFNFDIAAAAATEITAGTAGTFYRMVVFQGFLYGTSQSAGVNCTLYKYTGTATSRAFTSVGDVGSKVDDYTGELVVFNGRIYLFRNDGMWAYDGIRLAIVDDGTSNVDINNYRYPAILKGYLYYFMKDGMYRFNGNMIEKVYDSAEIGFPKHMVTGGSRLWIIYSNSEYSGVSRYDKSMGYDYTVTTTGINGRVACFDGKAIFTYSRTWNNDLVKNPMPDFSGQGENDRGVYFAGNIYVFTSYDKFTPGIYFKGGAAEMTDTGTASWKLITSIFDGGFPMIDKAIENLELVLDVDATADQTVNIEYRTTNFSDDDGWLSFGTFKTQTRLQEYVTTNADDEPVKFKQIQFRLSGTTNVDYGFKKLVIRYLLTPDLHWQWDFAVNAYGDNPVEPLMLKDNSESSQSVALLRGTIYNARMTGAPVSFLDVDQYDLTEACTDVDTHIHLDTSMLKSAGMIKVEDEIIQYTGKTATTITGCTRGLFGSAAAAHAQGTGAFAYYRVLIRKINNERIEMDDSDLDREVAKAKPSQISLIIQEV